ncbi:MAG: sulfurtransferase [Xanthomonadales bacterium]|nr:sulfurtransferase [Xanthomonadales bacterium]
MGELVEVERAAELVEGGTATLLDCRFDLGDTEAGQAAYRKGHIPGARYAHLDRDLSDLTRRGEGRHPLPTAEQFFGTLGTWGITHDRPVIVYDDGVGAIAARAWWLLRNAGHPDVRLLDGGLGAWQRANLPLATGTGDGPRSEDTWRWDGMPTIDSPALEDALRASSILLVDARAGERFTGQVEPLDRQAGHVPGAQNRPLQENCTAGGLFKSVELLRAEWGEVIAERSPRDIVHMCGSGVTACHNLLAMTHAGWPGSILYAPSWSGWIEDSQRPTATG